MIYVSPVSGDVRQEPVAWRYRTAFVMQQLGKPIPQAVTAARRVVKRCLADVGFQAIDAQSQTTGHDYLSKIWEQILTCPVGVAIVHEDIRAETLANIYFELGMLQAYGRETVVIRLGDAPLPSDLLRTEYVRGGKGLKKRFGRFAQSLHDREEYYLKVASTVERNPLLAIDYLRRAALLNGDHSLRERAKRVLDDSGVGERAKGAVESLMLDF